MKDSSWRWYKWTEQESQRKGEVRRESPRESLGGRKGGRKKIGGTRGDVSLTS